MTKWKRDSCKEAMNLIESAKDREYYLREDMEQII